MDVFSLYVVAFLIIAFAIFVVASIKSERHKLFQAKKPAARAEGEVSKRAGEDQILSEPVKPAS